MSVATVTKLEAANRQLCTAIRMFFADADAVAVQALACAAREIYEKHCHIAGRGRMFDYVKSGNPDHAEKKLWNLLNAARNFFKHEGASLEDRIEFDDTMNDFAILSACTDCTTLCSPNQPVEVQAFSIWFVAVEAPDEKAMTEADPADANACRAMQIEIDKLYPGLRMASRVEKKRFGARLLEDALAGRLVGYSAPSTSDTQISPNIFVGLQ